MNVHCRICHVTASSLSPALLYAFMFLSRPFPLIINAIEVCSSPFHFPAFPMLRHLWFVLFSIVRRGVPPPRPQFSVWVPCTKMKPTSILVETTLLALIMCWWFVSIMTSVCVGWKGFAFILSTFVGAGGSIENRQRDRQFFFSLSAPSRTFVVKTHCSAQQSRRTSTFFTALCSLMCLRLLFVFGKRH